MASIPLTDADLTEQGRQFAASIEAPRARWEYSFSATHFRYKTKRGPVVLCPNTRSMPVAAKLLGRRKFWVEYGLRQIRELGYERAEATHADHRVKYPFTFRQELFEVGPLQAWNVGHVYFARVVDHPHVLKIGFSRRVHERLDDIESKHGVRLIVRPGELKVGTLLNEHWWHHDWKRFSIAGEWFFDPFMTDRTVPAFLALMAEGA